ncbi:MAG: hypothetical protein AB8H03_28135 [Saprospiraceae bacterium]
MGNISLKLQKLGKRKINIIEIEVTDQINTLKDLIQACVKSEVKKYNDKKTTINLISFLTPTAIQNQSKTGKISFGDTANINKADLEKSLETVLQGFTDGLFVVFIDDEEIKNLDQKINLEGEPPITFLRLSFLTGTFW